MERWEKLAQDCNAVFAGQPMDDVGGALALLTAMLLAGVAQGEEDQGPQRMTWLVAQHGKLVLDLVPAFLEVVEKQGGWDEIAKKGRH
jgi:hypothetical protein